MTLFRWLLAAILVKMIAAQPTTPTVRSITSNCGDTGCLGGETMTISGTNLVDDQSFVAVSLAPDFFVSPAYQAYDCPVDYDQSNSFMVLCTLPFVPASYRGFTLMVNLTNDLGQIISYTGFITYSSSSLSLQVASGSICVAINGSALDACGSSDTFYVYGPNFQVDPSVTSMMVGLANPHMTNEWDCPFTDSAQTTLACTIPSAIGWDYDSWYSVSVKINSAWSDPISPGIRLRDPSSTTPNVLAVTSSCGSSCYSGIWLTIAGINLMDSTGYTSVQLAPTFWSTPPYEQIDCPVSFDFSTPTLLYCVLPDVPSDYLGITLMLQVTTADGQGVITGGVTYALPSSTGSYAGSSSTAWQPIPPIPNDSVSYHKSWVVGEWISLTVPFLLVLTLLVCLCARRRRQQRRLAALNSGASPAYVAIDNQPLNAPAAVVAPAPVVASPPVYPSVYAYQYPQQPAQHYQYPGAQFQPVYQPAQYQVPMYHQPSAPSAYPNVHQYQVV